VCAFAGEGDETGVLAGSAAAASGAEPAASAQTNEAAAAAQSEAAGPPNICLIVIDTLRADHVSCCGYERETTPNIDRLAAEGWLFTNNKSQSSYTRTSMTSMFTSRWTSDANLLPSPGSEDDDRVLAEILAENGYVNVAVQANPQMREDWGYARGFRMYRMEMPEGPTISLDGNWWLAKADRNYFYADAARVADVFEEVIANRGHRRLFVYVHFMDPHEPYMPPEAHQVFTEDPLDAGAAAAVSGDFITRKDAGLRESALALYDGEIRFADRAVGRMVETLKKRGIYDRTAIIIAADHGEEFLEHGGTRHSNGLYEEVIHTPLVVRIPGEKPAVCDRLTRNVDIAPTILRIAGIKDPWPGRDGVPLQDILSGSVDVTSSIARLYLDNNNTVRFWNAVQEGPLKFIDTHVEDFHYSELFDLSRDPGEKADLFRSRPKDAARLAETLESARGAARMRPSVTPDEQTLRLLKSLGYLQ